MAAFSDEEEVTFYPTYGYQQGDNWVIPMRVWVHERRSLIEHTIAQIAKIVAGGIGVHGPLESREVITFSFDEDSEEQHYSVEKSDGNIRFRSERPGCRDDKNTCAQSQNLIGTARIARWLANLPRHV